MSLYTIPDGDGDGYGDGDRFRSTIDNGNFVAMKSRWFSLVSAVHATVVPEKVDKRVSERSKQFIDSKTDGRSIRPFQGQLFLKIMQL